MKQLALIALVLTAASMRVVAATPAEDRAYEVISRYVLSYTGWKRDVFRIEKGRVLHGSVARYEVIYIPEEKLAFIGGAKSFAVEYDAREEKVVREWHYQ